MQLLIVIHGLEAVLIDVFGSRISYNMCLTVSYKSILIQDLLTDLQTF